MASGASDYFETKHELNASHLCEMYDFGYESARNVVELEEQLQTFYQDEGRPKLMEIFTPTEQNDLCLKAYFNALK